MNSIIRETHVLRSFSRILSRRFTTTSSQQPPVQSITNSQTETTKPVEHQPSQTKTQAELDEELRHKLAAIAGDGGEAGVEYEDGQPVAMKRAVRENMFRYI